MDAGGSGSPIFCNEFWRHYTTIHVYEGFSFQERDVTVAKAIYFSPKTESDLDSKILNMSTSNRHEI